MVPKKLSLKNLFILFLPLSLFISSLVLVVSFAVFKNSQPKELEAVITDGSFKPNEKIAYFMGEEIAPPNQPWPDPVVDQRVLSSQINDDKWIEIDLTNQKLRAWESNNLVYEFSVSTGKRQWGTATPVGVYRIWIKLKNTKMSGGSGSTYYYLPNVQCTQYFYKGYGIHGCYWHENFGHPMSHGCVNMRNEDACTLFYWTSPPIEPDKGTARPSNTYLGTRVVVHGETPWE